jgi:hypothetical protein
LGESSFAATGEYNATSNYNPYTIAPASGHILWTQPEAFGGLIGGEFGQSGITNYYSASQYEPKFAPLIMNGYLYYNEFPGSSTNPTGLVCQDLFTGQTLWTDNSDNYGGGSPQQSALTSAGTITTLICGQTIDFLSPNQYGALAYLWTIGTPVGIANPPGTSTLNMFDAKTGDYILSITGSPLAGLGSQSGMVLTEDASGNLIGYYVNNTAGTELIQSTPLNDNIGPILSTITATGPTLNKWNSTLCIMTGNWANSASGWYWRPPQEGIIPFNDGIMWAAPIATNIAGVPLPGSLAISNSIVGASSINSGVVCLQAFPAEGFLASGGFQAGYEIAAGYSANTGAQLWITNRTQPVSTRISLIGVGNGVYVEVNLETATLNGYSLDTGTQLWTKVLPNANSYDSIGGYTAVLANGVLYTWGLGGDIWAVQMTTGAILWETDTNTLIGASGGNTPYGVWPLWTFTDGTVADGMLFVPVGHEYSPPLFHGAQEICLNITNGQFVWSIMGFYVTNPPTIADGVMTMLNAYDNQIYAYGMGPSKTTVAAPDVGVTTSTPVTITGTVTDLSAGSKQTAVAANFPNGLPCVSDASMTQFMESVYMQQPEPHNVTGVPVTFAVIDSNGNYRTIGSTTTNGLGDYSFTWKPDIAGNYTVYATFAGTQSYYGSTASTGFYASSPGATQAPAATPLSGVATQTTLEYVGVAIIIVIIIGIAVLAMLVTRKHP